MLNQEQATYEKQRQEMLATVREKYATAEDLHGVMDKRLVSGSLDDILIVLIPCRTS